MKKNLKSCVITDKIRKVNPLSPDLNLINKAVKIIQNGGVVTFPTASLYGLAADIFDKAAVQKIFCIKQRPLSKPLLILIKDIEQLEKLVCDVPEAAKHLIRKFWPGDVTIVFKARSFLPETLTGGTKKIGIRLPSQEIALTLVKNLNNPITGTSANISGQEGCCDIKCLSQKIICNVDLVLDTGVLKGGMGSTVVDVTTNSPQILREGSVASDMIYSAL